MDLCVLYLDDDRIGVIEFMHEALQNIGPVVCLAAGDDGGNHGADRLAHVQVRVGGIEGMCATRLYIVEHGQRHRVKERPNIVLQRETSNRARIRLLVGHLGEDIHQVRVVVWDFVKRRQLLNIHPLVSLSFFFCSARTLFLYFISNLLHQGLVSAFRTHRITEQNEQVLQALLLWLPMNHRSEEKQCGWEGAITKRPYERRGKKKEREKI